MLELNRLKESYCLGRLLWMKGASAPVAIDGIREMLKFCEIDDSKLLSLSMRQFVNLVAFERKSPGACRNFWMNDHTLILGEFETEEGDHWRQFVEALREYPKLKFAYGIRIILASSNDFSREREEELNALNPTLIRISDSGRESPESNERIHRLLRTASLATHKPIWQMSEKAAVMIEMMMEESEDAELLDWLIWGVRRSKGKVLRFSDFFSSHTLKWLSRIKT